jgi:hypothetical protein
VYNLKLNGKVVNLTTGLCKAEDKIMAAATKTASHVDYRCVDAIFNAVFNLHQHTVWIQLYFISNQAVSVLFLSIYSTFLAPAEVNTDKLGLNHSKRI